jgi:hypothetical protein
MRFHWIAAAAVICLSLMRAAQAGVSAAEAEQLKSTLTPVGAERAANRDGSIPAWTGGYTTPIAGYRSGDARPDPFADDKPILTITAANVAQYADKLPEGARALFARFPDYRMTVYPTRRSAAAPQSVYDAIFRNATRAHAASEGIAYGIEGAAGGIPFPIPKNGFEVMWNHLLAFWGPARETHISTYVISAAGDIDRTAAYREVADFPYYYPGATPENFGNYYFKTLRVTDAPAVKFGEGYLAWQPINTERYKFAAWRYIPGERRARRGPSLSYDTPDPDASGFETLDEYYLFFGGLDRYDFKLVGKTEMYVPYNNNRLYTLPVNQVLGRNHANPDALRYELHRVWVVEATLAAGKHHIAPKRRFYIDEDTWFAVYAESWDEDGHLWKFGHATMYVVPDLPAVILGSQFIYDLTLGGYVYGFAFNGDPLQYKVTPPHPATALTPEALVSQGAR